MVEIRTPQRTPTARPADQIVVSSEDAQALGQLSGSMQRAADTFSQFYEEEAARQRELIAAEMQLEWARRFEETSADAPDGYATNFVSQFDAWRSEALSNAPKRGRADLEQAMDLYRMRLEDRAERAEIAARERRAAAAAAAARAAMNEAVNIERNALMRDPNPERLVELQELYPEAADDFVRTYDAGRMLTDPAAVMEDIRAGNRDAVYSPSQFANLLEAGQRAEERAAQEMEAARAAALGDLGDQASEDVAYMEANGFFPINSLAANLEELDAQLEQLLPDPEERAQVRAGFEESFAQARAVGTVIVATPDEIEAETARLVARVQEPGSTPEDQADLNRYVEAVQRRQQAFERDAAGQIVNRNDEVAALIGAIETAETPEEAQIAASRYRDALASQYDRLGILPELRRVLPAGTAQGIVQGIMRAEQEEPGTLPLRLEQLAETWGPGVVNELREAGLPTLASVAMRYTDNPGLAATILGLGDQTRADLAEGLLGTNVTRVTQLLDDAVAEYREAFETGDQTGVARTIFNETYGVAEMLALDRVRRGETPQNAVNAVFDQMFRETPVVSSRMRVLIPQDANPRRVEAALDRAISDDMIRAFEPEPFYDPTFPEFANQELVIRAARNGVWLNNSDNTGAVLNLDLGGGYYLPIRNSAGQYFEIPYQAPGSLYESLRYSMPDREPIGMRGDAFGGAVNMPVSP